MIFTFYFEFMLKNKENYFDLLNIRVKTVVIFADFLNGLPVRLNGDTYEDKVSVIIETAQRRFALYGAEKTTMREIAGDLKMTKGSLYYYFPDKENLYRAVIEKEQDEFIRVLEEELSNIKDPSEGIYRYVNHRLSYFRTMVNLGRMRAESYTEYKPLIAHSMARFREREKQLITGLLDSGNLSGMFDIRNTGETASLFLDLLKGLRSAVFAHKELIVIDDEEFMVMAGKAEQFTGIFIKGIKKVKANN